MIINGDALEVLKRLDDNSVQCFITSPPFYGLRRYGTPPILWGGDIACPHEWTIVHPPGHRASDTKPGKLQHDGNKNREQLTSELCTKCGAWRGELGLEPTPDMYVEHLTTICREVRRVLRKDGLFWLNIGDCRWKGKAEGDLKPKDLIEIPSDVAKALRKDGWYLRARLPWIKRNCLGSGTVVYTRSHKGVMPSTIHDLMKLNPESVEVWNGEKWTKVVHIQQTDTVEDGLEIVFRNGEKVTCTKDHRWPTTRGLFNAVDLRVGDVVKHTQLPDTGYVASDCVPDEVGRVVGLFLAEGSYLKEDINAGAVFTLSKKETHLDELIRAFALKYEGSHHSHTYDGDGKLMSVLHGKIPLAILSTYISNKGSKHKRLSNACWGRNNKFLKNLLMGYLEGDGHFDKKNNRWRLGFCGNDNLAQDIRTLCGRIGISLRLYRGMVSAIKGGKLYHMWRGQIRFDLEGKPCNSGGFKMKDDYEVISISKAKSQHFYDVGVEDEPHLFALASGALTHNSFPESVTDRPAAALEYVFILAKSGDTLFWTHPELPGVRKRPEPDYLYTNALTGESTRTPPADWVLLHYEKGGKQHAVWKRQNQWRGNDYFYDRIAVLQKSSESYNRDKRPRGALRQRVNKNSKYPDEGQFKKQDNTGNPQYTGFNERYAQKMAESGVIPTRNFRDSDFIFKTWQGLLQNEGGEPVALVVNPRSYKGAHFASFSPQLVEPMILASTSERGCCPHCGAPWVRIVDRDPYTYRPTTGSGNQKTDQDPDIAHGIAGTGGHVAVDFTTLRWEPSCKCDNNVPEPCLVCDPFGGSGATGVCAKELGRASIIIELKEEYCGLAEERIKNGK